MGPTLFAARRRRCVFQAMVVRSRLNFMRRAIPKLVCTGRTSCTTGRSGMVNTVITTSVPPLLLAVLLAGCGDFTREPEAVQCGRIESTNVELLVSVLPEGRMGGAEVRASQGSNVVARQADSHGCAHLSLGPGIWSVEVTKEGYRTAQQDTPDLQPPIVHRMGITLQPG
jgi:hypothetical protein